MENFGKFMAILLAMILSPIIRGFVFIKIWAWFIVPTFNVEPLRIVEAIGIMALVGYIFMKHEDNNKDDFWEKFITSFVFVILAAAFTLLFGWVVQLFI